MTVTRGTVFSVYDVPGVFGVSATVEDGVITTSPVPEEMTAAYARALGACITAAADELEACMSARVPDSVIVLLNHLEGLMDSGVLPEDAIPTEMWNAVSMHNYAATVSLDAVSVGMSALEDAGDAIQDARMKLSAILVARESRE